MVRRRAPSTGPAPAGRLRADRAEPRGRAQSKLIANPGCFPESALLALAPAVKAGIIGPEIIIDSKSGVSGAGRGLDLKYHFGEADESVSAYGLSGHRHLPEIVQELTAMWPKAEAPASPQPKVTFTPHLVPMTRGILSTCYAPLILRPVSATPQGCCSRALRGLLRRRAFVRVVDAPPATKQTRGNNMCLVLPNCGRADRAAGRGERARQPREGRGRAGDPEHERDAGPSRDDGPRCSSSVSLRRLNADERG